MSERPRVKICGLTRHEDAVWADQAGADFLGVVVSGGFRRSVPTGTATAVLKGTRARRVAVVVDEAPEVTAKLAGGMDASVVQLHGDEDEDMVHRVRALGPWILWKAVRAATIEDVTGAVERFAPLVDGILVEGWREGVVGGGGAAVTLDPSELRAVVPASVDFILAGGLDPTNVGDAVARFRPDVVDVSSGVEREVGRKSPELVTSFIEFVRHAPGRPTRHQEKGT